MDKIINQVLKENTIGIWKLDGNQLYGNDCFLDLIGVPKEMDAQACLKFHLSHVHPEDQEQFGEYVRKLSEERTEIVYRFLHPEKGVMMIRCSGKKMEDGTIAGIHQDISDIVRLEKDKILETYLAETNEKLRNQNVAQNDYYKEILDELPCGVFAYTVKEHKIVHLNKRALDMFHIDSFENAQSKMRAIFEKFEYPDSTTNERLIALRKYDNSVDFEVIINPKETYEVHALAKSKVFMNPDHERIIITVFLDISNMVMLKKALEQAKEGSAAKSAFLFNMSHDLRTPLTRLMTYIDILKLQNKSNESINKNLDILTSKVNELRDLSNLLLDFSIASSDENIHLDEPSFVEYAIGDYLSEMHTIISQNGFCVNIDGIYWEKVKVAVNGSLLSRIFSNLTNNICKYADIDEQVVMETVYSKNIFEICISNTVCKEKSLLESTGLGLKNVELLMRRMHGRAIYETKEYCFYVKLRFPITN